MRRLTGDNRWVNFQDHFIFNNLQIGGSMNIRQILNKYLDDNNLDGFKAIDSECYCLRDDYCPGCPLDCKAGLLAIDEDGDETIKPKEVLG